MIKRRAVVASAGLMALFLFAELLGVTELTPFSADAMERKSKSLVGKDGVDCGRVRIGTSPKAATDCALKSQAESRAFRVRYDIRGIDSNVAAGIVRTPSGKVVALSFDGDPAGQGGRSLLRQRVGVFQCPEPIRLWVNPSGRINCFQQESSPPANVMSPNIEAY